MATPELSLALQKRMKQSLATQGGDLGQELILVIERALEISTISLGNATFTQETVQLNEGGTTVALGGAGMELLGDADAVVGYVRVVQGDISLLEIKAPTGNVLTLNIDADSIYQASQDLIISGASPVTINQPLSTTSSPTFADLTITSFAANWTNAGRTVADLGIVTTVDINGGTIDGTSIGASVAASAVVSTLSIEADSLILDSDDAGGFTTTLTQSATAARVLTLPDVTGTLATLADVQGADELSEVLANGNTTGANDLIVTSGQKITTNTIDETTAATGVTIDGTIIKDNKITSGAGGGQIDLSSANSFFISSDEDTAAESFVFGDATDFQSGHISTGQIDFHKTAGDNQASLDLIVGGGFRPHILIKDTSANDAVMAAEDLQGVIINSASTISTGVTKTVIIGGSGIVASVNDTLYTQNLNASGTFITEGTTTSSGAGAVAITASIHEITTTGANALTLANGAEGQILKIVYAVEGAGGDVATLTPTSLAGADTTITFNDIGDTATLLFTAGTWFGIGAKDAVFA